jgi:nucleotide-binding universal stress UspA family protein
MGTIVVGFDRSEHSLDALRWAAAEAVLRNAHLRVITAWDVPFYFDSHDRSVRPQDQVYQDQVHQDTMTAVAEAVDQVVSDPAMFESIEMVVEHGSPTPLLLAQSVEADMVVVGARGTGGFLGLILGSTADKLTGHAKCPVVSVRSDEAK